MKKVFVSAIIIATIISVASAAFAGEKKENNKKEASSNEASISLRYMGEDEEYLVLQVLFSQKSAKDALLRITDEVGEELYTERTKDNEYVRYIKVLPDEIRNLEIIALTSSGNIRKKYNLNLTTVTSVKVQEVAIK
jgi:hypothetical protein